MSGLKSPPTPLYQRGEPSRSNLKFPPFPKGDKGGFLLRSVSSKQRRPLQQAAFTSAQSKKNRLNISLVFLPVAIILWCLGCGTTIYVSPEPSPVAQQERLAQLGYSVQVGAFANLDNAVRLSETLERYGLDAYYFVHETGLYKVRFGDFPTKEAARSKAEDARAAGIIDEYWIVSPADYAVQKHGRHGGG